MKTASRASSGVRARCERTQWRVAALGGVVLVVVMSLAACMMGPDYRRPEAQIPEGFKEGVDWQRASDIIGAAAPLAAQQRG